MVALTRADLCEKGRFKSGCGVVGGVVVPGAMVQLSTTKDCASGQLTMAALKRADLCEKDWFKNGCNVLGVYNKSPGAI